MPYAHQICHLIGREVGQDETLASAFLHISIKATSFDERRFNDNPRVPD
jgi:hypothetical protein